MEVKEVEKVLKSTLSSQFFTVGQGFLIDVKGSLMVFNVLDLKVVDIKSKEEEKDKKNKKDKKEASVSCGMLTESTIITLERATGSTLKLIGEDGVQATAIFKPNFDFSQLGIGGLHEQFDLIFRRAFEPRVIPASVLQKLGVNPVKGILLYGPPGTGKTLMARQIGMMLNRKEPIIVNGPDVLDKYVGESERKIRDLFQPAEDEWKLKGTASDLHIIVLDELDAICKKRGKGSTGGTGVGDTVVNQLLSKMDGYNQMNNLLIIGMTNRIDMIDEALLRPGRLEVHIEISLPDEQGRLQILQIHTTTMKKSGLLSDDVNLPLLASVTKNYSGAELMGLVQNSATWAMHRHIDSSDPTHPIDPESITVTQTDFEKALLESKPQFGVAETDLAKSFPNGILEFSDAFLKLTNKSKFLNELLWSVCYYMDALVLEKLLWLHI